MTVDEGDARKIIADVEATSWRLCETIRVRELAATHRLGQMRRLRMLEEQKAWKREADFDRIETTAEMDAERFRTSIVSEPFYSKLCNPRWPHNPDEFTLELRVDVERLRMESILSQPAPRRLPAIGTGRMNLEYRELNQQRGNKFSLFKSVWTFFCASIAQARSRNAFCSNQTSG